MVAIAWDKKRVYEDHLSTATLFWFMNMTTIYKDQFDRKRFGSDNSYWNPFTVVRDSILESSCKVLSSAHIRPTLKSC